MQRRQFLFVGTSLLFLPALPRVASGASRGDTLRLRLHYRSPDGDDAPIDARALPSGDARFARTPAWMHVEGLRDAAAARRAGLVDLRLRIGFPADPAHAHEPMFADVWHFGRRREAGTTPATRFVVPVDPSRGLPLRVETTWAPWAAGRLAQIATALTAGHAAATAPRARTATMFVTPGSVPGLPRLRRGRYALVIGRGAGAPEIVFSIDDAPRAAASTANV